MKWLYSQPDSQNVFAVRSLSNREREVPIINAKCWQKSHWSRRRDSCVLHLWTAGVLRQLVTLQPLMGGVGRGLARQWPDYPTVPRPLSHCLTQTFSLPKALAPLEFSLYMDYKYLSASPILLNGFQCGNDDLRQATERGTKRPNTWMNHVTYYAERKQNGSYFLPAAFF